MKDKIIIFMRNYKIWIIGIIFITLYLYSNMVIGEYKLSYTNFMYATKPWQSLGVKVEGPFLSDVVDAFMPSKYEVFHLDEGFSLWSNKTALGNPKQLDIIMYPLNYLYLLPIDIAVFLNSFLKFIITFFGMYIFMGKSNVSKLAAIISGITYTFSSALVVWHGWPHSDVAAFAPYAFWALENLIEKVNIKYMLILAVVLYLMLVAGMPTYAAYFMYLLGFYLLYKTMSHHKFHKKSILIVFFLFSVSVILAVFASLPYTGSLLNTVGSNGYAASRGGQATATLNFNYLRTILYPYIRNGLSHHINEGTLYIGLLPIVLFPLTFYRFKEKKQIKFWTISGLIVLLLIFTNTLDMIYMQLPFINTSIKFRIIVLFCLISSIVTGINLNDLLQNKINYMKNKVIWVLVAIFTLGIFLMSSNSIIEIDSYKFEIIKCGITILLMLFAIYYILRSQKEAIHIILMILVVINMVSFAKAYLPWIEKDAKIIPNATDTIKFLQSNGNQNRMIGLGDWVLFPNTNVYYELNDVRGHNFVFTNNDMKNYFSEISFSSFSSPTRVSPLKIDNYNLLKYLGVRYIVGEGYDDKIELGNISMDKEPVGEIINGVRIEQSFTVDRNNFSGVELLLATYKKDIKSDDVLNIELIDYKTGKEVFNHQVKLSKIADNRFYKINFNPIRNSANNEYKLIVTSNADKQNAITMWKNTEDSIVGNLIINGDKKSGNIIINTLFNSIEYPMVFEGNDELKVFELDNYSDRFEIISNVVICESEDEVLTKMSEKCSENTIFILDEYKHGKNYYNKIAENEFIETLDYKPDYIKLNVSLNRPRYLLVNDYYDKDWKVYVDGVQTEMFKANYLMRASFIETSGNHIVELRYEPKTTMIFIYISIISMAVTFVIACFSNKIQNRLDGISK